MRPTNCLLVTATRFGTRLSLCLLWVLLCLGLASVDASARRTDGALYDLAPGGQLADPFVPDRPAAFEREQGDTIWFGGDDGTGYAVEGGLWDFEGVGGQGDFQGWTSVDVTENTADYFRRVTGEDFAGDPCVPMFPGTIGQIWCGVHEEEAYQLDYVTGMGYGNHFCQYARSPKFAPGDVSVTFEYFCDSEHDYDYTYLYVICFDADGVAWPDGHLQFEQLHGVIGSYDAPESYSGGVDSAQFPAWADSVAFEIRFVSDGAWSDEDGLYDSACGAFGADDIELVVGTEVLAADFEEDGGGYTFSRCEGAGTFMGLVDEATYSQWLDYMGVLCGCELSGWVIEFNDEDDSPYTIPGHPELQRECGVSGTVDRTAHNPQDFNTTVVALDAYLSMPQPVGVFFRPGFMYYPYTTEANPDPRWSPRVGQNTFWYSGDTVCHSQFYNLTTLGGQAGIPLPDDYEQVRFIFEVYSSCVAFGIPPTVCTSPGDTHGAPLIDNVQVGLTYRPDAPAVALNTGHQWHDGFGQRFPAYLDPADVGNADIGWDWSMTNVEPDPENDWLGDSAVILGPTVTSESGRWLVDLCVHVERKGPLQDAVPEYLAWKSRLQDDPETGFACVLMDSVQSYYGAWPNKFATYFHEADPGFDPAFPDLSARQEILPDSIWSPGTRVQYYYRAYWYRGGAQPDEYFRYPSNPDEFEILPGMVSAPGEPYDIQWPAVLYIDAFNRGGEYYVEPMLDAAGLIHDRYDYLSSSSGWHPPLRRSFGGTRFNPGGWGNSGIPDAHALGYRLLLLDTGAFGEGAMERKDWALFDNWIQATGCGLTTTRRGLLFVGDQVAAILDHHETTGRPFLQNVLGVDVLGTSIREWADVTDDCLYLAPSDPHAYEGSLPWTLYGNDCPNLFDFNVLGLSGVDGALGNLTYSDGTDAWEYAEIVRDQVGVGSNNWRSAVTGFALYHMSYDGCGGETCRADSVCIVTAGADFLQATVDWMTEGAEPFDPWFFDCGLSGTDDPTTHLSGPVTHLYAARPNPFHGTATIRFSLARSEGVQLTVYDVTGRRVRDLVDASLAGNQEHSVVWDGTDDQGRPVQAGVYWMQLSTESGYTSVRRMVTIR